MAAALDIPELKRRIDSLATEQERSICESHWQDIVDYLLPGVQSFVSRKQGDKDMGKIYDSTGTHALFTSVQGLFGLVCNPATRWFAVTAERENLNEAGGVKDWLRHVETVFYAVFNKTNFYNEVQEFLKHWLGLSTAVQYVASHNRRGVHFKTMHLGQCFIAENQFGDVDTLYRKFPMTARQMAAEWKGTVSKDVTAAIKDNPETMFDVVHAVYPRQTTGKRQDNRGMPWASVYFEFGHDHKLAESGYREFPYMVSRFARAAEEKYGRGLGMIALPDVKMLNRMERDILRAGAKRVDPPMLLTSDTLINPLRADPGDILQANVDTVKDKWAFLVSPGDLGYEEQKLEQKRTQIRQIFFNDLLDLAGGPDMTAFEVGQRVERKMRNMGGSFGNLQSDYFSPLFDRVFSLLLDAGYLPPPPQELWGQALKIDYLSPLALAQRTAEADGMVRGVSFVGQMAQINQDVLDLPNYEQIARKLGDIYGMPMLSVEDVKKLREFKQKQQQAQEMAAMAAQAAQAAPGLSKAIEPGSPLHMLAGGGGGAMQGAPNAA